MNCLHTWSITFDPHNHPIVPISQKTKITQPTRTRAFNLDLSASGAQHPSLMTQAITNKFLIRTSFAFYPRLGHRRAPNILVQAGGTQGERWALEQTASTQSQVVAGVKLIYHSGLPSVFTENLLEVEYLASSSLGSHYTLAQQQLPPFVENLYARCATIISINNFSLFLNYF